jgi:surface polysaccharide O-acyltransferase-like enzyme
MIKTRSIESQNNNAISTVYPRQESQVLWINNARISAAFIVVLLHVSAGVVLGIQNTNSLYWWTGEIFDSLSKWCIPVFVMISGMLLLDTAKSEPILIFYKKRLSRIFIPLVFWTFFFLGFKYFMSLITTGTAISIGKLGVSIVAGDPYYHLWYLYMILGLYLFTPFIRPIVKHSSNNELIFLCLALFAFSMAGTFFMYYFTPHIWPAILKFVFYLPYFLAGYLIFKTEYNPPVWILFVVLVITVILNSLGYHNSTLMNGTSNGYFDDYLSITIIPMSISMIFLLKRFLVPVINYSTSSKLALLSFGIYLIHPAVISILGFFGIEARLYNPLVSIPVITIAVFILSLMGVLAINKIPGFNRIIGIH